MFSLSTSVVVLAGLVSNCLAFPTRFNGGCYVPVSEIRMSCCVVFGFGFGFVFEFLFCFLSMKQLF